MSKVVRPFSTTLNEAKRPHSRNLELLLARERYEFDYVPLVANLLELVPVRNVEEKQVV